MTACVSQLQQASEWRSSQPLLSVVDRKAGAYDAGALSHFNDLVDSMASTVVGTAITLCEFSLEGDSGLEFPFGRTGLRSSVEKTEREVKDIAALHNLPIPSFRLQTTESAMEVAEPTNGFHNVTLSEIETPLEGLEDSDDNSKDMKGKSLSTRERTANQPRADSDSDDSSFGVVGGWGADGSDDDDDSSASLGLKTSMFVTST